MAFVRTGSGISSQALFLEVDLVVYVEGSARSSGGEDEDVGCTASLDGLFWKGVIGHVYPGLRVHIKPFGPKTALLQMAFGLDDRSNGKVVVAVDSDYDNFRNVNYPRFVVDTYRYSWESDVWSCETTKNVALGLTTVDPLPALVSDRVDAVDGAFLRRITKSSLMDAKLCLMGAEQSFFDRTRPGAYVSQKDGVPTYDRAAALRSARRVRSAIGRPARMPQANGFDVKRNLYGKVRAEFCRRMVRFTLKQCGSQAQINNDALQAHAVRSFIANIAGAHNIEQVEHYRQRLTTAMASG